MKSGTQRPFRTEPRPLTSSGAFQPISTPAGLSGGLSTQQRAPLQHTPADMKRKIQHQFEKEKSDKYFKLLTQFFVGEMTKIEFDETIKSFLTESQRKLHNLFLLTILRTTYCSLNSTAPVRQDTRLTSYEPTLCVGPKEIHLQPDWSRLQHQMEFKAATLGIHGVDNAAVTSLLIALEHHLKSIVFNARPSSRHIQRVPISPIHQYLALRGHQEVFNYNRPSTISVEDLENSLLVTPNALSRKRVAPSDLDDAHIYRYHYTTQHQNFYSYPQTGPESSHENSFNNLASNKADNDSTTKKDEIEIKPSFVSPKRRKISPAELTNS